VNSKLKYGAILAEVWQFERFAAGDPKRVNTAVRTHWTIENQLHWMLGVAFREDDGRGRRGHAAENLVITQSS
jgi:hypothetical protein